MIQAMQRLDFPTPIRPFRPVETGQSIELRAVSVGGREYQDVRKRLTLWMKSDRSQRDRRIGPATICAVDLTDPVD
jgi:hypothetical protein